jgi:hypothetical protein
MNDLDMPLQNARPRLVRQDAGPVREPLRVRVDLNNHWNGSPPYTTIAIHPNGMTVFRDEVQMNAQGRILYMDGHIARFSDQHGPHGEAILLAHVPDLIMGMRRKKKSKSMKQKKSKSMKQKKSKKSKKQKKSKAKQSRRLKN